MSHRTPEFCCLNCGKSLDAATGVATETSPSSGDLSICFYCHHVMAYAEDLTLRELTEDEVVEIAGDREFILAMKMLEKQK